jgi:hypothetical protein
MTSEPFNPAAIDDYKINAPLDTPCPNWPQIYLAFCVIIAFAGSKMCKPFTSNLAP